MFFDFCYLFKGESQIGKTFFSGISGKSFIHVAPFIVFAVCCCFEIFFCVSDAV